MYNKMEIELDREKIEREGYDYGEYVVWLDGLFAEKNLPRDKSALPSLLYGGKNPGKDWGNVLLMSVILENTPEFFGNCRKWSWLSEKYGNNYEEDILKHLNEKHGRIGA